MTEATAQFTSPSATFDLPLIPASEGSSGYDISQMLKKTGNVTLDVGFVNTASCASSITYIDGGNGILRYRGYPIDQLAENSTFMEVCALLLDGELPQEERIAGLKKQVRAFEQLPEGMEALFDLFPKEQHPMTSLAASVSLLSGHHRYTNDIRDEAAVDRAASILIGAIPTLAAYAYRRRNGLDIIPPNPEMGYAENFLHMMFGGEVDPESAAILDKLFTLHADHEQNCSTSAVRLVGSSEADLFMSIISGIGALSGPLHGGANSAVLEMLEEIQASGDDVDTFMDKVKNKVDGVRLMGFGHRVYKNYDPRAALVKKATHTILDKGGVKDTGLELAMGLEEIALKDDYFVSRSLYPNVDFYTGLIYRSLGFPTDMFTVLFAIGRMPGWISQWKEMRQDPSTKIGRPRQVYVGATERQWVPISDR